MCTPGKHQIKVRPNRILYLRLRWVGGATKPPIAEILAHSFTFRNRKALVMTETELRLIAAPAMIGLSSKPKNG